MELDTMFTEQINLKIDCIGCGNKTYQEHDSGNYVCINCGTLSTIQHNQELDFNDKNNHKSFYNKGGRRNYGCQDEEDGIKEDDTNTNYFDETNYQTSNSINNGMRTPRMSYMDSEGEEVQIKSKYEKIIDYQKMFLQVFKQFFSYLASTDPLNFNEETNKQLNLVAKSIWVDHIKNETNGYKLKNPKVRSRRNTEDRPDIKSKKDYLLDGTNKQEKSSKKSLFSQLSSRKLMKSEILNLDAYKSQNLKSRDKIKKYLEEYDELSHNLNSQNETMSYDNLLSLTHTLDKRTCKSIIDNNCGYEELIHKFFISKQLNYKHLYKEISKSDLNKFNSDVILSMIKVILQSVDKTKNTLFKSIVSFYKISNNKSEIKFLKYINKDKLLHNVDTMQLRYDILMDYVSFFKYVSKSLLNLPDYFTKCCSGVYSKCEDIINKSRTHVHTNENFCIGIIIYCLKLFYGLNDLTYLSVLKNRNNAHFPKDLEHLIIEVLK